MLITALVPVYNEEESLEKLYPRLKSALESLKMGYEIIFVDDGSSDSTLDILKKLAAKDKSIRIFSFRKHQGKAEALTYGFQRAKGDYVVTLDADLQDRPEEIQNLLNKSKEGFELVCGWRKNRKDSIIMKIPSKFFNFVMSAFWGVHLHDYNCGLKLYTKEAAKVLNLYGGMHRFIPLLVSEKGFEVTELAVVHEPRKFGKSKYGFSKVFKDIPDMFTILFLTKYAKRPLHFFGFAGGVLSAIGFFILFYLLIVKILGESIGTRPLLTFGVLLVLVGLQILFTGLIADMILSIAVKNEGNRMVEELKYSTE
ncbi:MAG: glycosyl transferase [Candidatus Levybacteria bacterium RIFCSPLOWO2_01_FULL_36_13]|nr:MAG: glycosyl transferase [Candidatus Levybacteria bacterium RIFCSPHIGHO2_01_FULL_36_15b]OGH35633.1 MAG: glycosyl transferase [Candidatus Levybacteria bacterium RIFCSPLOWO2_01_FULL_36_13]